MKTKMLTGLVFLCLSWMILAVDGFSATAQQKPKMRHISWDVPPPETGVPPPAPYQYPTGGIKYNTSCMNIMPEVGVIIQHDQIGDTWYDFQHNGSVGRKISVTNSGYRHFSWMYTAGPYGGGVARGVYANCKDSSGGFLGMATVDLSSTTTPGYCNQMHLHTGESVVIYHKSNPPSPSYFWATTLSKDTVVCGGFFTKHWDLPDYIANSASGLPGMWPKAEVLYGDSSGLDYIHIVMTEANTAGGMPVMVAYERCYFGTNDSVICQAFQGGSTKRYAIKNDVPGPGSFAPISHFDTSCSITPVVVVSPVSERVASAFLKPADPAGTCDYSSDVCYIESMHNGDDWIAGNPWPPPEYNITHFGLTGYERGYNDLNACYDYQDSLHIVYVTCGFDPSQPGYYMPGVARLYHWSKKDGVSPITSAIWEAAPGSHNANIAKMSISAQDPIYHLKGDTTYLFTIWTQFDSADLSANGYTNGEIYVSGSFNGGATWGHEFNLTNTRTPGCAPGNCLSEHWSSMAQNMYDGDLHIQYICDRDPGSALSGQDYGSTWQDNPVMYLHLSPWYPPPPCCCTYSIVSPNNWCLPPLKITPNGTRILLFKVYSIGYTTCIFSVTSDDPCIQVSVPPTPLSPRDSATVSVTLSGSGACNNSFIDGNVIFHTNNWEGEDHYLPVQAVVADDYYECPKDSATFDSLDNGVLALYVNANSQERFHDVSAEAGPDTSFDVFLNGGTIVATTRDNDTLVGRYMDYNDQHAGAREILYLNSMYNDFSLLYTWNVFMHNFWPPVDIKWYWWEWSQQIIFFKSTASDALKHTVIKFITVERHDPPAWWPEQPTFYGYYDTYIGAAMDIDCPWDTMGYESARNRAGYDSTNNIAWQKGFGRAGEHPQYNNYYAGMALAQGRQLGESTVPYSTHNVKDNLYLYPQHPWGWKEGELFQLAADPTIGYVQDRYPYDSLVDRSQVFIARKIPAGTNANTRASFTLIEAIAPSATKGLAELQAIMAEAQAWVTARPLILCGDCNNSGLVELGDVVCMISFLYKNGEPSVGPPLRIDCNNTGEVELGDVVALISYLYKNGPVPLCGGVW